MPRVYVIQNTHRLNRDTHTLEPKYDFDEAKQFGDVVFLLSPMAKPHDPTVIKELREKLRDITTHDYLLLVGNPSLIGFACAVAADATDGRLKVLQWDGKNKAYVCVSANLRATFKTRCRVHTFVNDVCRDCGICEDA
jgi:hypothetical protein